MSYCGDQTSGSELTPKLLHHTQYISTQMQKPWVVIDFHMTTSCFSSPPLHFPLLSSPLILFTFWFNIRNFTNIVSFGTYSLEHVNLQTMLSKIRPRLSSPRTVPTNILRRFLLMTSNMAWSYSTPGTRGMMGSITELELRYFIQVLRGTYKKNKDSDKLY